MSTTPRHDPRYEEALEKARSGDEQFGDLVSLLMAAHDAGDARATYALATWHLHGRVFKRNVRRAVALLRNAASRGIPDALYDLAVCYEKGIGVSKNLKRAFWLYLRAAIRGEKQSVYEVGRCYYHGVGVDMDRDIARIWLDRAKELDAAE